jgi:hypothetical protein
MRCHHQNPDCFKPLAERVCAARAAGHPGVTVPTRPVVSTAVGAAAGRRGHLRPLQRQ